MANQIRYDVDFNVKQGGLKQIKSSLQDIQKLKLNDIMKIDSSAVAPTLDVLKSVQADASKVEQALTKAFNVKLDSLNIDKFNRQLSSAGLSIDKVQTSFARIGTSGQAAFNNLATQILNTNVQLRQTSKFLDNMATTMANTVKWGISSSIFREITGSIQQAYYYAKDLDKSLTNIAIVTGDSADQMQRFGKSANAAAKDLGRSTLDYTKAALTFYQQGLSDEQVQARTKVSLKAQNITGFGEQIADSLTAVWNGFNVGAEEAELYVDKLAAVADSTASNMGQLATAISKVASTANAMGVDIDQLTGQLSTVIAVTRQAPESAGVAFKTIYARMNDIKTGADEAQVSLGHYSGKMAELGFNVLDANGSLRDTGQVIEEIGGRWNELTRQQQINLAQIMAGQRQYNNLIALFDNWDKYLQAVNTSMNAQGTLNQKNDVYLDSLAAHMQQLSTQAEKTYDILFDEKSVKGWVDGLNGALTIFNKFIDGLGGGTTVFTYFGSLIAGIFDKQIVQAIQGAKIEFDRFISSFKSNDVKQQTINQIKFGLQGQYAGQGKTLGDHALTVQAEAAQKTLAVQRGLTAEQQKQAIELQKQIGLTQQKIDSLQAQQKEAQQTSERIIKQYNYQKLSVEQIQKKKQFLEQEHALTKETYDIVEKVDIALKTQIGTQQQKKDLAKQISDEEENIVAVFQLQNQGAQNLKEKTDSFKESLKIVKDYLEGNNTDVEAFNKAWNEVYGVVNNVSKAQQKEISDIELLLQKLGVDTSKLTDEQKKLLGILKEENQVLAEQGKKTIDWQKLVRGASAAGQIMSSLAGAMKTFGDESATAEQKANSVVSTIQSSVSAVGTMFGPIGMGVATLANGIISLTPLGKVLENMFKSTKQRIDEMNESLIKSQETTTNYQNSKTKIQGLAEEFQILSKKAGRYNQNISNMTQEQQTRYREIVQEIINTNPSVIEGFTAQGDAIIETNTALQKTLDLLDKQYEKQMALLYNSDKMVSNADTLNKARDEKNAVGKSDMNLELMSDFDLSNVQQWAGLMIDTASGDFTIDAYSGFSDPLSKIVQVLNDSGFSSKADVATQLSEIRINFIDNLNSAQGDAELIFKAIEDFYNNVNEIFNNNTSLFQNDSVQQLSFLREFNDNYLNNILTSLGEAKEKLQNMKDEAGAQYDQALGTFKASMVKAILHTPEYNSGYEEIKTGMGNLFTDDLSNLLTGIITEQVNNFNYDDESINFETLPQEVAKFVNEKITNAFGNITAESLTLTREQLGNLPDQMKEIPIQEYNYLLEMILNDFLKENENFAAMLGSSADEDSYNIAAGIIEALFGDFGIQVSDYVEGHKAEFTSSALQAQNEIRNAIMDAIPPVLPGTKERVSSSLFDWLTSEYDADKIYEIFQGLRNGTLVLDYDSVSNLENFQQAIRNFFLGIKASQSQVDIDEFLSHFDKINKIIDKVKDNKTLEYSDQLKLMDWLGLNPEQVQNSQQILNAYAAQIKRLADQGDQLARFQGLSKIFTTFESLKDDSLLKSFGVKPEQIDALWDSILQAELNGISKDQAFLANWAESRGKIFKAGKEGNAQEILEAYNFEQQVSNLQSLAKGLEQVGDSYDTQSDSFIEFKTQLEGIFGEDVELSDEQVISMLTDIETYLDGNIELSDELRQALKKIFSEEPEDPVKRIVDNFDKVSAVIKDLQNNKVLNWEQEASLKDIFDISQQELKNWGKGEELLKNIRNQLLNTLDPKSAEWLKALQLFNPTIEQWHDSMYEALKSGNTELRDGLIKIYDTVWQSELDSLNISEEALAKYAQMIGKPFKTNFDKQTVLNSYKLAQNLEQVSKNASSAADAIKDYTQNTKSYDAVIDDIIILQDSLFKLFGEEYSSDFIVSNINAIIKALEMGITDAELFNQVIKTGNVNFTYEKPKQQTTYETDKKQYDNAVSAQSALESRSAIKGQQAQSLYQLEAEYEQLGAIVEKLGEQGRYTEQYKTKLVQILGIEKERLQSNRTDAISALEKQLQDMQSIGWALDVINDKTNKYSQAEKDIANSLLTSYGGPLSAQQKYNELKGHQAQIQQTINELRQAGYQITPPEDKKSIDDRVKQYGLNADEFESWLAILKVQNKQLKLTNEQLQQMALYQMRVSQGTEDLIDNWDDWTQALDDYIKSGKDISAIAEDWDDMSQAFDNLFNMQPGTMDLLGPDFVADNLDLIEDVKNGVEGAYQELQGIIESQLVLNLHPEANIQEFNSLYNQIQDLELQLDELGQYQVGVPIDDKSFIQACQNMIEAAHWTADEAEAAFSRMGYDIEFQDTPAQIDESTTADLQVLHPTTYKVVAIGPQQLGMISLPVSNIEVDTPARTESVGKMPIPTAKAGGTAIKTITPNGKSSGGNISRKTAGRKNSGGGGGGKGKSCFVAGTLVSTNQGFENIENIKIGDIVLSHNLKTHKNEYSEVLQTMIHDTTEEIYSIHVQNDIIQSTGIHKFLIVRNQKVDWIPAQELKVTDLVHFSDGSLHKIDEIHVQIKTLTVYNFEVSNNHNYYVGQNGILVHNKGGKGGGGGKGSQPDKTQKDLKKALEDERDIYHDINIQLDQINRNLDRTQKKQDRLYGKQLLDNLNKQTQILQQHNLKLKEKQDLQQQDLRSQQDTLKNLGVTFDQYGNIANYMDILGQKQGQINKAIEEENQLIKAYNESTDKDIKKGIADEITKADKKVKQAEDAYKNLEDKIKDYDDLREDMEDLVDDIEENLQQQIEIEITKFRMEVEIRLQMGEAERDWNKFVRQVLEHDNIMTDSNFDKILKDTNQNIQDATSYFNVAGSPGAIQKLTDQLYSTLNESQIMKNGGWSTIYGDNQAQAMQDMQNDLNQLMNQMEDLESLIQDIDEAYLDTIDDIQDQFDKQIEDYEYVGELLEHDMDLLELLYGDRNYEAMDKYYTKLQQNNNRQLDSLNKQRDFWKDQWQQAVARGDTKAAEQFKENYKNTIKELNDLIEDSAKNLQQKYENAINGIFYNLDKKLSGGLGTDYLDMQWELMNKNADEYLDTINSAFAIQETQRKYQKALDETKSIKNQQALKKLMNQQLDILKNKEKLTEYDVERAEKLLQIEQARIALEESQSSKTSMRLKRDSQGNYSYEYVADKNAIDDAQANLAAAQNDLYNFDKDRYQSNLNDILSVVKEFNQKYKEIILDTSLTEEERVKSLALLRQQCGEYINDKLAENLHIRGNLRESAFADLAALYKTDVANYYQMVEEQQDVLMNELVPMWESGIQKMSDKIAGEGGFIQACQWAFEELNQVTQAYISSLDEMADIAGFDFNDVRNGIDDTVDQMQSLIMSNQQLISLMGSQILTVTQLRMQAQALTEQYKLVYEAAKAAATAIHDYIQAEKNLVSYNTTGTSSNSSSSKSSTSSGTSSTKKTTSSTSSSTSGSTGTGSGSDGGGGSNNSGTKSNTTTTKSNTTKKVATKTNSHQSPINNINNTKKKKVTFATGGYTGDWNSDEGRIAVLHQKELVLNEKDTENFLDSMYILRSITDSLNGNIYERLSGVRNSNIFSSSGDGLEQNVHIEATFPNVDSKRQIEEAFSELVNMAAQRAMRR